MNKVTYSKLAIAVATALAFNSPAQAANTTHTLTTTGASNWSTATWTGSAPTSASIGDIGIYNTAATAATTALDVNVTLGVLRNNNTGVWTVDVGAGTLTMDGTGLTSGNSPFANAGVAAIANTSTAAGGMTVNAPISIANTNLDIGTTNTGSTIIAGAITATTAQSLNFRANGTGAITDSAAIGASGSNIAISNLGTSSGLTTLSGALGASVTSVTQNSATSALTLSGANGSFAGPVTLTAGTLNIGNAAALGTGNLTIGTGTTLNTSGGAQTLSSNNTQTWNGNFTFTGTANLTFGTGAITMAGNTAITASANTLTENGAIGGGAFNLTKLGAGTLVVTGANTYSGATTIGTTGATTNGGTLTLSGAAGTINSTTGVSINGSGSKLLLDNTAASLERVSNSANVNLSLGGELSMTAASTAVQTETINTLGFGAGGSIVSLAATGAGSVTKIAAAGLSRTSNGTGFIRATSFGQLTTVVGQLSLTTQPTGANFVGAGGAAAGTGTIKNLAIIPWLMGDTNAAGALGNSGTSGLVTYDTTTNSLRTLVAGEYDGFSTTYANVGNNVLWNSVGTQTMTGAGAVNQTWNALLFGNNSGTLAGAAATTLTVSSGVIASETNLSQTINGFSTITLGNGEGVITTGSGSTTTIGTQLDVTSGGGITKTGGGTLSISNSNILFTGAVTINQGTFALGTVTNATVANNIVGNGGALTFTPSGTSTFSGNLSGFSLAVTQATAGATTVLSGTNSYSGATTVTSGTLQLNNSAALSSNSALQLNSGATLALRADADTTFTPSVINNLARNVTLTFNVNNLTAGTGKTLTLAGAFNFSQQGGNLGVDTNTINVTGGNGYTLGLGAVQTEANGTGGQVNIFDVASGVGLKIASVGFTQGQFVTFQNGGNITVGDMAVNNRSAGLTMNGTGILTLNGSFTRTTGTDNIALNNGTTVVNNTAVTSGGSFSLNNLGSTTATANNVSLLLGGTNGQTGGAGDNGGVTFGGAIGARDIDTGLLTIGGQNTSGTNTYSGILTLGVTASTGKDVTLQSATGGQVDFTNNIVFNAGATTGGITVGSTGNAGTIRLAGANTYKGATTIFNGTLLADSVQALNTNAAGGNVTFTGGTLKFGSTFASGANADISARIKNSTSAIKIDTNGTTAVNYTSAIDSSNTGGLTKLGSGTLTLSNGSNAYTGTTTVAAGTLSAASLGSGAINVTGGSAASAVLTISAGTNFSSRSVGISSVNGGGYNKSLNNGTSFVQYGKAISSFAGGQVDTTAEFLDGVAGSNLTMTTSFSDSPAALVLNDGSRRSDVFSLSGTGSDLFVLQLDVAAGSVAATQFLGWNQSNTWVNAVLGNTGNNATVDEQGYQGSFADFQSNNGFDLTTYIGAYGVDVTNGSVWAVLDHNSEFALVPEPSTWGMIIASLGLFFVVNRKRGGRED